MPEAQPASKKARASSGAAAAAASPAAAAAAAAAAPAAPPPFGLPALAGLSKSSKARAGPPPLSATGDDEEVWVVHVPRELDLDALDGVKLQMQGGADDDNAKDAADDEDNADVVGRLSLPASVAAARDTAEAWVLRRESAASAAELFSVLAGEKGGRAVPVARRLALAHDGAARRAALAARFGWGAAAGGGDDKEKKRRRGGGSSDEEEDDKSSGSSDDDSGSDEEERRRRKEKKEKKDKKKKDKKDKKKDKRPKGDK
jgi:hypothetical protein